MRRSVLACVAAGLAGLGLAGCATSTKVEQFTVTDQQRPVAVLNGGTVFALGRRAVADFSVEYQPAVHHADRRQRPSV